MTVKKGNSIKELSVTAEDILSPTRSEDNYSELYVDGPELLSMLLREIKNARYFIHFQIMLFYSDEVGIKIAEALAEKAREGVLVRVMSDSELSFVARAMEKIRSSGSSNFEKLKKIFSDAGVKFVASDNETYTFFNWEEKRQELERKGVPEEFLQMQDVIQKKIDSDVDVFDHRKLLVFDGETAVITGANIGKHYLYEKSPAAEGDHDGTRWHDGAVLLKGPIASILNRDFASKWMVRGGDIFDYKKHFRSSKRYGTDICTLMSHFPHKEENPIRDWYFDRLRNCSGEFIIENAYINDEEFWRQLSSLEKSQAEKISLINPYKAKGNDFPQNESVIRCRMWEPFQKGVSFYAFQKRMTHWKIALDVAASTVCIGSYNLNHRSALHDFEMNVLVESETLSEQVLEMFQKDMAESAKITDGQEFYRNPNLHPSCLVLEVTEYFE